MHKNNHKLRIGIVGAGNIVRTRHLPALKTHPGVEIVAVSNSTYESSENFCRDNSLSALPMRDWAELVASPDIDIVWIGTTPYMHSAVTISALEAGKHVFCQARMSMDLAEAEEMLAASKRFPELVTMLCPPPFGLRGDLMMKKILAENYIGQPHHVRLQSFHGNYLDADTPAHWRQKIEISGLNTLTLGIYVEVLQRWLGDITGVFARGKVIHPVREVYNVVVPDLLTVLCSFENGAEGVLEFSGINALAEGDRLEIYGSAGTLSVRLHSRRDADGKGGRSRIARCGYSLGIGRRMARGRRFSRCCKIKGARACPSEFRRWPSLHARRASCRRFSCAQRMGGNPELNSPGSLRRPIWHEISPHHERPD